MANKKILPKIANIKATIGVLSKNAQNPFFKSKYLDLNEILSNLEPLLESAQMVLLQPIINNEVVTQLFDLESEDMVMSSIKLPDLTDPQKIGSAITYYRRYSLQSLFSLQAEDDDANKASGKQKTETPKQPYEILESCTSIDELAKAYTALSTADKKKYEDLKNNLKLKLSK